MSQNRRIVIGVTGLLMFVGSFLPWVTSGIFSLAGTSGDGIFTLVLGVIVGIGAVVAGPRNASAFALIGGLVSGWISWSVIQRLEVEEVGNGLTLVATASVVAFIGGLGGIFELRKFNRAHHEAD